MGYAKPALFRRGVLPYYVCGWRAQTVKHLLIYCGHYNSRGLISLTGTEDIRVMLLHPIKVKVVVRWLINQEAINQFYVTKEMEIEEIGGYTLL